MGNPGQAAAGSLNSHARSSRRQRPGQWKLATLDGGWRDLGTRRQAAMPGDNRTVGSRGDRFRVVGSSKDRRLRHLFHVEPSYCRTKILRPYTDGGAPGTYQVAITSRSADNAESAPPAEATTGRACQGSGLNCTPWKRPGPSIAQRVPIGQACRPGSRRGQQDAGRHPAHRRSRRRRPRTGGGLPAQRGMSDHAKTS
jgi:hypothetical protein